MPPCEWPTMFDLGCPGRGEHLGDERGQFGGGVGDVLVTLAQAAGGTAEVRRRRRSSRRRPAAGTAR